MSKKKKEIVKPVIVVKLDMTFEKAMKKALSTPLPKKQKRKLNDAT